MSVKIRLRRMGRHKRPLYAVVATDSRNPRDGRFIEDLGRYQPINEPAAVELNEDRLFYWLDNGAQPSDTVRNLLSAEGLMLKLHLRRKGKSAEEIEAALADWRAKKSQPESGVKLTAAERRRAALREERERVAAEEAKVARAREEADRRAQAEAEEARRQQAAERERAAEQARAQQEQANTAAEQEPAAPQEPAAEEAPKAPAGSMQAETDATLPETRPDEVPAADPGEAGAEPAEGTDKV